MGKYFIVIFFLYFSCTLSDEQRYKTAELITAKQVPKNLVEKVKLKNGTKILIYDDSTWTVDTSKIESKKPINKKLVKATTSSVSNVNTLYSNKTSTVKKTYKKSNKNTYTSSGYCGARTKSGGSCRRKVSGGGYCWQHRG